jgi:hypothetical protein
MTSVFSGAITHSYAFKWVLKITGFLFLKDLRSLKSTEEC